MGEYLRDRLLEDHNYYEVRKAFNERRNEELLAQRKAEFDRRRRMLEREALERRREAEERERAATTSVHPIYGLGGYNARVSSASRGTIYDRPDATRVVEPPKPKVPIRERIKGNRMVQWFVNEYMETPKGAPSDSSNETPKEEEGPDHR